MLPGNVAAALEVFEPLGLPLTHRARWGGLFYADGRTFAPLMPGLGLGLCIRARGALAERMSAERSEQFIRTKPSDGSCKLMGDWSLPEAALDDPQAACDWADETFKEG